MECSLEREMATEKKKKTIVGKEKWKSKLAERGNLKGGYCPWTTSSSW